MSVDRAQSSSNWRTRDANATRPTAEPAHKRQAKNPLFRWENREDRSPFEDRKELQGEVAHRVADNARIYVGNMPYTAQKEDVKKLFEEYAIEIVNIDISIDPFTFRNPSYCFVNLQSAAAAQLAMQTLSGQDFRGRPLKVKPCVKKSAKPMGHESDPLVSNRWRPNSVDRAHTNYTTSDQYALSSDSSAPMQDKRRVYVGNLPRPVDNHMSDLEIRDLFKDFVVLAVSKVNWPRGDPTPPGKRYAFVDLASNEEAERAIAELHGLSIWGDHLVVKLVTGNGPKPLDIP